MRGKKKRREVERVNGREGGTEGERGGTEDAELRKLRGS